MKPEEWLITLMQGLTHHALAEHGQLREQLPVLAGQVIRVTLHSPYVTFYLIFEELTLEYQLEYEGDITVRVDREALTLARALLVPPTFNSSLENCFTIEHEPVLSAFLMELSQSWNLWNLTRIICSEFTPFFNDHDTISIAQFESLGRLISQQFDGLDGRYAALLLHQQKQEQLLLKMSKQLFWLGFGLLLVFTVLTVFLMLFLM